MANVDYNEGLYTLQAGETHTFPFWWPTPQPNGKEFFDVSISPQFDKTHTTMKPLVQVEKSWGYRVEEGHIHPVQWYMYLKLNNPNDFAVQFLANHVRVY